MFNEAAGAQLRGGRSNFMKNLSISMKLIVGFGIILFLLILSIVLSMISITSVNNQVEAYGHYTVPNTNSTWAMRNEMASVQRHLLRSLVVKDALSVKDELDQASKEAQALQTTLQEYADNQRGKEQDSHIQDIRSQLSQAASIRGEFADLLALSTPESLLMAQDLFLNEYSPILEQVEGKLEALNNDEGILAQEQAVAGDNAANLAWVLLICVAAVSILITVFVTFAIRKSILSPVREIEGVYSEMAKGNMQVQLSYESQDELGSMARSIRKTNSLLASYIQDISEKLSQISRGDMRINVDMDYIGDFAAIKQAIQNTASALNHTLLTINTAAEQVSTGAAQVSSGAQALATGSTEQASSVEELSASASKISVQAAENSANVKIATQHMEQASIFVRDGSEHMSRLTEAMANIGSVSNQIASITKVIEDIAFQTNILALNAAIEAARAGNAGKGFAVVADEVRNLAAKSAEAAKQTAELIQRSAVTVAEGTQITARTAQILQNVEEKAGLVNESIVKIHESSSEQAVAIEQIKQGLNQVSSVVQTNAATAEENSATSEEMSAQAATLREEVGKFRLDSGYEKDSLAAISLFKEPLAAGKTSYKAASSLGKY